jgi:hypothetical protein
VNAQIPNQIEYNKTLARRVIKVMEGAYPKLVYNENVIDNPDDLDNVGAKIAVRGQEPITNYVGFLPATSMSTDVLSLGNDLMKLTQEMSGASEAALGKINPEQASGRAILAVQDASAQIMSLQMQQHEQFVEDMARILLDFWTAYMDENGKTVKTEDENGNPTNTKISKEILDSLKVNIKVEVSPTSAYSLIAQEQSLENYLKEKYITFEELVDALPDNAVAPKQILKSILKKREEKAKKIAEEAAKNTPKLLMPGAVEQGIPGAAGAPQGVDPAAVVQQMQAIQGTLAQANGAPQGVPIG